MVSKISKTKVQSNSIQAFLGSDESEVKRSAKEMAERLLPAGAGDFGGDIIDGVAESADQAATKIHQTIEALMTFPFFGGEKLVWLKNANFLGDNILGRSTGVLEALEKLTEVLSAGLPDNIKLLLSATEVDKRRAFFKNLSKLAKVTVFDKLDSSRSGWEEAAMSIVQKRASDNNLKFNSEALELFTLFTGGDNRQMDNEIEKLDLYLGASRREVTVADVRLIVPKSRAGIIFELGNAIAERDIQHSLMLVGQLLFQGETAIGILLATIVPTVRNLLFVKDLMEQHRISKPHTPFQFISVLNRLPEEATQHLPRKKDGAINGFALGIAACHSHRYKIEELRDLLDCCLKTNVQLVTTQLDAQTVLNKLVAKLVVS